MTSPLFAPDDRTAPRDHRPRPAPAAVGLAPGDRVLGYVSAPTGPDGAGIHASTRAIQAACDREGWRLIDTFHDLERDRTMRRPRLFAALEQIADGGARGLVVSHARLLGSSVTDLARILSWFRDARAVFVGLDLGLDTSTPTGRRMAVAMIRLSGWDRGTVVNGRGKRAAPTWHAGHRDLLAQVLAMQEDEMSLQEIADRLNADGVPTMNGGDRWWPSSVRTALRYARGAAAGPADGLPSLEERTRS